MGDESRKVGNGRKGRKGVEDGRELDGRWERRLFDKLKRKKKIDAMGWQKGGAAAAAGDGREYPLSAFSILWTLLVGNI